jgi:hypothetical protein
MTMPQTFLLYSFIHQWLYSPLLGPVLFFSSVIFFIQSVGLLVRVISPSQGRYLHAGQHKQRINVHTDIHALSWTRTDDPSVRASEDSNVFAYVKKISDWESVGVTAVNKGACIL